MDKEIEKKHHFTFEQIKQINSERQEFWYARDLLVVLGYSSWDKFKRVIQKAMNSCENSGQLVDNHFSQAEKKVELGSWLKPHSKQGLKLIWILLFFKIMAIKGFMEDWMRKGYIKERDYKRAKEFLTIWVVLS